MSIEESDKRRRILTAARALLGEQAYEDTPVSEIVKRAEVAQGTFYRYFPSKTALLGALAEELDQEMVRVISDALHQDLPLDMILEQGLARSLVAAEPYRDVLPLMDLEALFFGSSSTAQARREPYVQQMVTTLERDRARGHIDPTIDPALTARLICSVLDRITRDCLLHLTDIPTDHYIAQTLAFIRRALGVTPT